MAALANKIPPTEKRTPTRWPRAVAKRAANSESKRKSEATATTTSAGGALELQKLLHEQFEIPAEGKTIPAHQPTKPPGKRKPVAKKTKEPVVVDPALEPDKRGVSERGNTRVFDRISVDGSIRFEDIDYRISDLSVGGLSVVGSVSGWEEGEIRRVEFTIRHGEMEVSGNPNFQRLENGGNGITRFKLVNPSEDMTEFFRAATLRSVSGAEYDVGWLPENSSRMQKAENRPRQSLASHILSLPMLVLAMFMLLIGAFLARKTDGEAHWVTETHQIVSPVTGQITSLGNGPFDVGEPISEIAVMTVTGEARPFTVRAKVASVSVAWRFSTGDQITADDVLGYLHNVPQNDGRFFAIVSLQIPFFQPSLGDSVVMESIGGQRIVGKLRRFLSRRQVRNHATNNDQFAPHKPYALVEISDAAVDFSASPKVRILDTVFENTLR